MPVTLSTPNGERTIELVSPRQRLRIEEIRSEPKGMREAEKVLAFYTEKRHRKISDEFKKMGLFIRPDHKISSNPHPEHKAVTQEMIRKEFEIAHHLKKKMPGNFSEPYFLFSVNGVLAYVQEYLPLKAIIDMGEDVAFYKFYDKVRKDLPRIAEEMVKHGFPHLDLIGNATFNKENGDIIIRNTLPVGRNISPRESMEIIKTQIDFIFKRVEEELEKYTNRGKHLLTNGANSKPNGTLSPLLEVPIVRKRISRFLRVLERNRDLAVMVAENNTEGIKKLLEARRN